MNAAQIIVVLLTFTLAHRAFKATRKSLTTLCVVLVLIPATLVTPNPVTRAGAIATVTRVVLVAALSGIAWRARTRELPAQALRPPRVTWLVGVVLVVALVDGVGFAIDRVDPLQGFLSWLNLADQLCCLWLGWVIVRLHGVRPLMRALSIALFASVLVSFLEKLTGIAWGQFIFAGERSQLAQDAAYPLSARDGGVRVRAGAEFALEFGWTCALLMPVAIMTLATSARQWRRRMVLPVVALTLLAVYWSVSRTAIVATALELPLLALLARDRILYRFTAVLAGLAALGIAAYPSVLSVLSTKVDLGSITVRGQRFGVILGVVASHPWGGVGLGGLDAFDVPTTDASYLQTYAEQGVLGLLLLLLLLVVAFIGILPALRAWRRTERLAAAAIVAAVVTGILGAFTLDLYAVLGAARPFWLLVGAGLALADAQRRAESPARVLPAFTLPSRLHLGLAAGVTAFGLLVGTATATLWPGRAVTEASFFTLTPQDEAAPFDAVATGDQVALTVCGIVTGLPLHAKVVCRDTHRGPGVGLIRLETADRANLEATEGTISSAVLAAGLGVVRVIPTSTVFDAVPTAVRTCPLWLGFLLGSVSLLVPGRVWRRTLRRPGTPVGIPAAAAPPWPAARLPLREPARVA